MSRDHRHPYDIERVLDNMKDIRTRQGKTQDELADEVGVPRTYISRWESRIVPPNFNHLVILHRILCAWRMEQERTHG